MANDKHYNSHLYAQLTRLVAAGDWDKLIVYLKRISNSEFRTAGYILGERIMPMLSDASFWSLFVFLVKYNSKAFLVTSLKALEGRTPESGLQLNAPDLISLFEMWRGGEHPIDVNKFLSRTLPLLHDSNQIAELFQHLQIESLKIQIDYLIRCDSEAAYYLLFCTLKRAELPEDELRKIVLFLVRKGGDISFNLASIITHYFDITQVQGVFSLRLEAHELNYLDRSIEAFRKVLYSV